MFNYDKIMRENTVVHCDTEEKANKLLEWADSRGLKWRSKDSYLEFNNWNIYKEKTCYYIYEGKQSDLEYFKENNYIILSYEDVLLQSEYDLIFKIETGDFGNRCETVYCKDYGVGGLINYQGYSLGLNSAYISYLSYDKIFIGEKNDEYGYVPDKTKILSIFQEFSRVRKWKVKVIYDGEEVEYYNGSGIISINGNCNITQISYLTTLPYNSIIGYAELRGAGGISLNCKENTNKKQEEVKMGKKADVKVTVIKIDRTTGAVELIDKYHTEIISVNKEKRVCTADSYTYENVVRLTVDGIDEIGYQMPKVVKIDNREEKLKLILEQTKVNTQLRMNLIESTPKIEGKLVEIEEKIKTLPSFVSYELEWVKNSHSLDMIDNEVKKIESEILKNK